MIRPIGLISLIVFLLLAIPHPSPLNAQNQTTQCNPATNGGSCQNPSFCANGVSWQDAGQLDCPTGKTCCVRRTEDVKTDDPYLLKETANFAGMRQPQLGTSLPVVIGRIIRAVLTLIGVVFFGLFIYGGIKWMTARGMEEIVAESKRILEGALIGLIVIIISYAVAAYIIERVFT